MVLILELKTTQTAAIKILTDTLNSLLSDVNFIFYPMYIEDDLTDSDENKTESNEKKIGGVIIKEINKIVNIIKI